MTLRPLRTDEFESSYAVRLEADPTTQPIVPERDALLARFERSGIMRELGLEFVSYALTRDTWSAGGGGIPPA